MLLPGQLCLLCSDAGRRVVSLSCGHNFHEDCLRDLIWDTTGSDVVGEEGYVFCSLCEHGTRFRVGSTCLLLERRALFTASQN